MSDNKIVDFMQVKAERASRIEEIDKAVDDSDKEIADLNAAVQTLVKRTPEFTSMDDAKSKINTFLS